MALYECVFIARQDISASQVEGLVDQFAGVVESGGGQITKKEMWGLRGLAYRIKKNRKGHYALLNIDAPSEALLEMERNMRLHEDVLRFLTVRVAALEDGPSVIMQARERRDDRQRGGVRGGGRGSSRRRDAPAGAAKPDGPGREDAKTDAPASAAKADASAGAAKPDGPDGDGADPDGADTEAPANGGPAAENPSEQRKASES